MAAGEMVGIDVIKETETPVEGNFVRIYLADGKILEVQYEPAQDCITVRAKEQLIIKTKSSNLTYIDTERW